MPGPTDKVTTIFCHCPGHQETVTPVQMFDLTLATLLAEKKTTKIIKDAKDSLIKNVYSEQNMPTNSIIKDITRFINQGTEFQMYIVKVFTE